MLKYKRIKAGKSYIEAFCMNLKKGYVMCGYLNISVANKFKDVAIKITGVSNIEEALKARVHSFTTAAKKIGIYKNQSIKEVLKIISQ